MWSLIFSFLQSIISLIVPIFLKIITALNAMEILLNLMRKIKNSMKRILLKVDELSTDSYSQHKVAAVVYDENSNEVIEHEILESNQLDSSLKSKFNKNDMIVVETI